MKTPRTMFSSLLRRPNSGPSPGSRPTWGDIADAAGFSCTLPQDQMELTNDEYRIYRAHITSFRAMRRLKHALYQEWLCLLQTVHWGHEQQTGTCLIEPEKYETFKRVLEAWMVAAEAAAEVRSFLVISTSKELPASGPFLRWLIPGGDDKASAAAAAPDTDEQRLELLLAAHDITHRCMLDYRRSLCSATHAIRAIAADVKTRAFEADEEQIRLDRSAGRRRRASAPPSGDPSRLADAADPRPKLLQKAAAVFPDEAADLEEGDKLSRFPFVPYTVIEPNVPVIEYSLPGQNEVDVVIPPRPATATTATSAAGQKSGSVSSRMASSLRSLSWKTPNKDRKSSMASNDSYDSGIGM